MADVTRGKNACFKPVSDNDQSFEASDAKGSRVASFLVAISVGRRGYPSAQYHSARSSNHDVRMRCHRFRSNRISRCSAIRSRTRGNAWFYRTKISRCYLGASNPGPPESNRQIIERRNDDLHLKDLCQVAKPIHLICTAANDISGDPLGTLYRGARSAVLSGNGISIGDETRSLDDLRVQQR